MRQSHYIKLMILGVILTLAPSNSIYGQNIPQAKCLSAYGETKCGYSCVAAYGEKVKVKKDNLSLMSLE